MDILGTVIAGQGTPSISEFSFVIRKPVKHGEFVSVKTEDGLLIGNIENIYKTNKYFESAGAASDLTSSKNADASFPIGEWEYTIAEVKTLSVKSSSGLLKRPSFPPAPGSDVLPLTPEFLNLFLGLDQEKGINIGQVQQHSLPAKFNITKMLQKHLAIIAMSGSGKSYATAVLIEELLSRTSENGQVALLIIDNHGEYVNMKEYPEFQNKISIIDSENIKFDISYFGEYGLKALLPGMSRPQVRELGRIIRELKSQNNRYSLSSLIERVKEDEVMKPSVRNALCSWLDQLDHMKIFSSAEYPNLDNMLELGKAVIIDLSKTLDITRKQIIVDYISKKMFNLRRRNKCPPYFEIIEEAHNFCPEGVKVENALSKNIIETIAREGRKFFAGICLISQRPARLSTTALSQCNTQIILRINNPNDLDHISRSFESVSSQTTKMISALRVGEALILGEAVNYPVFVNIRERKSKEKEERDLEQYSREYLESAKTLASADDFI